MARASMAGLKTFTTQEPVSDEFEDEDVPDGTS